MEAIDAADKVVGEVRDLRHPLTRALQICGRHQAFVAEAAPCRP